MRFRDFHPNVKLRIGLSFFTNVLGNMVTPFMAVYFAATLGTTIAGVATIISIIVGLVSATLGGYYADRIGRKKIMVLAESLGAIAYLTMAVANSPWVHSAAVTLVMSMVVSAAWGLSHPAFEAMLIDVSTKEMRTHMYRITYWSHNLAFAAAGMIGGYFFSDYLFELLVAVALMSTISYFITLFFIKETMPAADAAAKDQQELPTNKKTSILGSYKPVFQDRKFMIFILASILTVSVEFNLSNYIGIRLSDEMHAAQWLPWLEAKVDGVQMLGYLITENTLGVVLISLFITRLLKGKSDTKTMLTALTVNITCYSFLAFSNQPALLMLFMFIATVGELIYMPIQQSLLVNIVPDHARSLYMAIHGMTYRGAQMLCGLYVIFGGFLSSGWMTGLIFMTGMAGLLLLASITPSLQADHKQMHTEAA